jgi:hypothetical protein
MPAAPAINSTFASLKKSLNPTEIDHLLRALTEKPKEIVRFINFLDSHRGKDSTLDIPQEALIPQYFEWIKRQAQRPDFSIAADEIPLASRQILEASHARYQALTRNLWSQEGGSGSVDDLLKIMRLHGHRNTKASLATGIRNQLQDKTLIGIKEGSGGKSPWRVPLWQVNKNTGTVYPEIKAVCQVFRDNGFAVLQFMLSNDIEGLANRPFDYLGQNQEDKLLAAAKRYDHQNDNE